jgi:hypothetical protein
VYNTRPLDIFQMFEEASTGHSGALGRQVTLNTRTTNGSLAAGTEAQLAALEAADVRGVVNLRGNGLRFGGATTMTFNQSTGLYQPMNLDRATLLAEAASGVTMITFTAHLRSSVNEDVAQPLLAPIGAQCDTGAGTASDPVLPTGTSITLEGAHVSESDVVFMNGQPTPAASITLLGTSTACAQADGPVTTQLIQIDGISPGAGIDLLQVKNAAGLLSNELPIP